MKQVLIIDASPLFREFVKSRLKEENVNVEIATGKRDAYTKLVSILPDLVIIDVASTFSDLIEFLQKKQNDPNASKIPVIISGPVIETDEVAILTQYNVIKYFNKPIKFDIFFESIGRVLHINFTLDTTPCILEIHLNDNILFIEIAQGLNRDKLILLKYKLSEVLDANHLTVPKVILMMTDLSLSFVDGANLELLLDNVIADQRIQAKNVKVLSLDSFTRELINGHPEYHDIEVITNLQNVLNALIDNTDTNDIADLISNKILTQTDDTTQGSVQMRFSSESSSDSTDTDNTIENNEYTVAIIDDDPIARTVLQKTFENARMKVTQFSSGVEFMAATNNTVFSIAILDILMPGISGFDVLLNLRNKRYTGPVIVYSGAPNREYVIQALTLGAKTYLIKPLQPEIILRKTLDILEA